MSAASELNDEVAANYNRINMQKLTPNKNGNRLFKVFFSPNYYANIGEDHVFPIKKFQLVRDLLVQEGTLDESEIVEPPPADVQDILLVHDKKYVEKIIHGTLEPLEVRRLGLPWSPSLVRRSFLATSGTILAAQHALQSGIGSNLAGGTHHAYADRGEGFCVFNDVAVAIAVLRREGLANRFLIVDCDVHQGNGTAHIFGDDADVFTFSMHGAKNYPLFKEKSSLDIELEDGTNDDEYIEILSEALPRIDFYAPDLIFYLGGADPFENDKLGRLKLTKEGLKNRDRVVLNFARQMHIPIVTTMSGGYGRDILDTVDIHANTIRAVKEIFK